MSETFANNEEIILAAHHRLPRDAWNYLVGASESETSMRRNRLAFDRKALLPRVLVDVSNRSAATTLMGHALRMPVILAPMGSLQRFSRGGGADSTRAAAEFGSLHVVSSVTQPSLEEISAAVDHPKILQLYIHGDWEWTEAKLAQIKAAGYAGLCITVDTQVASHRDRVFVGEWAPPNTPSNNDPKYQASMTWEKLDQIKDAIGLPMMIKGIATAADAKLAVQHGIDVVWISNHGGRQLDHSRGTLDMLAEVVAAVDGKAEVVLDGGIQRGTDVVKAVAMGAKAVAIGKLQGWGLGADGSAGLVRVLEVLEEEVRIAMGLMGVPTIDDLTADYVCAAESVVLPHEMSSWVNMPGGRLL